MTSRASRFEPPDRSRRRHRGVQLHRQVHRATPDDPGATDQDVDQSPAAPGHRGHHCGGGASPVHRPRGAVESLRGADVLYNTYWVRFQRGRFHFGEAVANTRILLGAARDAGVRKVVHVSVSNPSEESELDYYAGKGRTERIVRESGLAWA